MGESGSLNRGRTMRQDEPRALSSAESWNDELRLVVTFATERRSKAALGFPSYNSMPDRKVSRTPFGVFRTRHCEYRYKL